MTDGLQLLDTLLAVDIRDRASFEVLPLFSALSSSPTSANYFSFGCLIMKAAPLKCFVLL